MPPTTRVERVVPNATPTSNVLPEGEYGRARPIDTKVSSNTAPKPSPAETVRSSRTTGMVTVRLVPVPARKRPSGTAA
jgi:hypothetical protein